MHDPTLHLTVEPGLKIRTIVPEDLENLRTWKNAHRQFFFYQQEILPPAQQAWYAGYLNRPEDYMFIVEVDGRAVGCMGIRGTQESWDVYNVILGVTEFTGRGLMTKAFQAMLKFAFERVDRPITLSVLKSNPAIGWYQKNGFKTTDSGDDHLKMRHAGAAAKA